MSSLMLGCMRLFEGVALLYYVPNRYILNTLIVCLYEIYSFINIYNSQPINYINSYRSKHEKIPEHPGRIRPKQNLILQE